MPSGPISKHEKERYRRIERRINWLRTRIFQKKGIDSTFDQAEVSALDWALRVIREHFQLGEEFIPEGSELQTYEAKNIENGLGKVSKMRETI